MQNYAPNTAVTVTAQLVGDDGNPLVPTSLQWRVLDESDTELQAWASVTLPDPTAPVVSVTVSDALNTLGAGVVRGIRRIEFKVVTATSTVVIDQSYLLQASSALVFGVNTFLTHSQALLLSMDFAPSYLVGWRNALTKEDQEQALIQAHSRLVRLRYHMEFTDDQSRIIYHPWGRSSFIDLTPAQVADLEANMLKALKRAQLIEAAHVLTEDGVNAARKDGLMSMTVGESSQFFVPSKPLDLGVCRDAYAEIARYVDRTIRLGRG